MKTIQDYEEYPSFKSLQMGANENDVQLRATGYFVKTSVLHIKESLQEIEECIESLEGNIKELLGEVSTRNNDHMAA